MSKNLFNVDDNYNDLPDALKAEIKGGPTLTEKCVDIFIKGGGTLTISEAMVGFYKEHSTVLKRNYAVALLYRMHKNGILKRTGKRGEYRIVEALK